MERGDCAKAVRYQIPRVTHVADQAQLRERSQSGLLHGTKRNDKPIMAGRARLLLRRAEQVVTIAGPNRARIGAEMSKLGIIPHASVVVGADGRIVEVSTDSLAVLTAKHNPEHIVDCVGKTILPGFVDPHTHTVFAGDRSTEMGLKLAGATYDEVHAAGGGINRTVTATRQASHGTLTMTALRRLDKMTAAGTTHVEIKSGYGMDWETELKMLQVIEALRRKHPVGISSTYLAHSIPAGRTAEDYTNEVIAEHLPALAKLVEAGELNLDFIDVFCERGFFDAEQSRQIMEVGKRMGLAPSFHGDELTDMDCGVLAANVGAKAVSHLEELSAKGIAAMAAAKVVGVLLPTTAHVLRLKPPPARAMIEGGVAVALATDYNPNAHWMSMPAVMQLACVMMHMSMEEAIVASTINAAAALGREEHSGSIEVGKQGDLVILDAPNFEHLVYQHDPPISDVFIGGRGIQASPAVRPTAFATSKQESQPLVQLQKGIPLTGLPKHQHVDPAMPHAPKRTHGLTASEKRLAVQNALRYFPSEDHAELGQEFLDELDTYGHIYMYRLRPTEYEMKAHPIDQYPAQTTQAAAIQLMIMNNLDPRVAQYPHELITYGGNGSVFSNWAQYHLTMKYLSQMTENQTLELYSGHPMGLFPSHPAAPRVVVTNGMVIPNYSSRGDYERMYAQGVSQYGQMTAGSFCYIGPQGIVHGTTLTLMNAARKYLDTDSLKGRLYVTSGLGGMSGAQAKAAVIAGAVAIVAEVKGDVVTKRHDQGWVSEVAADLDDCVARATAAVAEGRATSIAFHGNVVELWEHLAESDLVVDLGSDQTSCHNPFGGGYYPAGMSVTEADEMMAADPDQFHEAVQASLRRHCAAVNTLTERGDGKAMRFWDYGNSFLLEAGRAGADVMRDDSGKFRYPSYVEDIMGDIFSLGFGPFRWVCSSCDPRDLQTTDDIAAEVMARLRDECATRDDAYSKAALQHFEDNHQWILDAGGHELTVGSLARILYANGRARSEIAAAFNEAVATGRLRAPVILSRDHHDVSGTDAPWRETADVTDGSQFTADMAVHNVIGDATRGATWVQIHNGGGTGWGEAMNGGFGHVLDGRPDSGKRATDMLRFDVLNGVSRRAWAGNSNAAKCVEDAPREGFYELDVTVRNDVDPAVLDKLTF